MTDSKPSKSARKRAQLGLQQLGEELIKLRDDELLALPLEDQLRDAVREARTMHKHGALRRQKQLIGKLMRSVDAEPIRAALAILKADDRRAKRLFASAERWRNRIIDNEAGALDEFQVQTNGVANNLRALVDELNRAQSEANRKATSRKIFRTIHNALELAQDDKLAP